MPIETAVALIGALTALVVAIGKILVDLAELKVQAQRNHDAINGRMGDVLTASVMAARKTGELEGRDFKARRRAPRGDSDSATSP